MVGKPTPGGPTEKLVGELALGDRVRFVHGISDDELAELIASAEIAVVPSLYEGFSLPAVEHMASGTPLVASRTGALPEVTGRRRRAGRAGRPRGARGRAARGCTTRPAERERLGAAALRRVQERFAWPAVARATVAAVPQRGDRRRRRARPAAQGAGPC